VIGSRELIGFIRSSPGSIFDYAGVPLNVLFVEWDCCADQSKLPHPSQLRARMGHPKINCPTFANYWQYGPPSSRSWLVRAVARALELFRLEVCDQAIDEGLQLAFHHLVELVQR
jgi:hypothetical protein